MSDTNISSSLDFSSPIQALFPYLGSVEHVDELSRIHADPISRLNDFYLFSVSGIVFSQTEPDKYMFLEKQFQSLLSAAYQAKWKTLTAIIGSGSGIKIYVGFAPMEYDSTVSPKVFERVMNGLVPGLKINFSQDSNIENFIGQKEFGGLITGIPVLQVDNEHQKFDLTSIIRSMNGEMYSLFILSEPIEKNIIARQIERISKIRDDCHGMARMSLSRQRGENYQESTTENFSQSFSDSSSLSIILASNSVSEQNTKGKSFAELYGINWSEGYSAEIQNSIALELEKLTVSFSERFLKAFNIGEWKSTITFVTESKEAREVLAGTILGELAAPSSNILPSNYFSQTLNENGYPKILLPDTDNISDIFNSSFSSYLTSDELASISSPPVEHFPGYEIQTIPSFSLTDTSCQHSDQIDTDSLGAICENGNILEGVNIKLKRSDLSKHLFVCGLTGSGKTTTVKEILAKCNSSFLVLESAKREYRQLYTIKEFRENLRIFSIGNSKISPFSMNPFYIMPGVSPISHIDFLKAIFNASFALYGPMPYILEQCIHNIYLKWGWNLAEGYHPDLIDSEKNEVDDLYKTPQIRHYFPTISDLKIEVERYIKSELDYRGEISDNIRTAIVTRLESLCVGAKGDLFNSTLPIDIKTLLEGRTVLELEDLSDDDDKAFFVGIILTYISEYRQLNDPARNSLYEDTELEHLLVIEEAHRLLKNVSQEKQTEQLGNPKGKAVEFFANVISEMRSKKQGVVVVEQIPTKIIPDVIKNTNTKIVHRIVSSDDQTLMSSTIGLTTEESIYLTSLKSGHMLYMKEGMQRPIEVNVNFTLEPSPIEDETVREFMKSIHDNTKQDIEIQQVRNLLAEKGEAISVKTLCSIAIRDDEEKCKKVVKDAITALKDLLKSSTQEFSDDIIQYYLQDRIVAKLLRGTFRIDRNSTSNISKIIEKFIKFEFPSEFYKILKSGWKTNDIKEEVIYRVQELVLARTLHKKYTLKNETEINEICKTYFLVDVPEIRRIIVSKVQSRIGG